MRVANFIKEIPTNALDGQLENWYYQMFLELPSVNDKKIVVKKDGNQIKTFVQDEEGKPTAIKDKRELLGAELITNINDTKELLKQLSKIV